jgi:hypothetical protein
MGPTNALVGKKTHPLSLRARFGIDGTMNALHGSDSSESACREIQLVFKISITRVSPMKSQDLALQPLKSQPEKTLHEALAKGITLLCRREPKLKALEACKWLGDYLVQHAQAKATFQDNTSRNTASTINTCRNTTPIKAKPIDLGIPSLASLQIVAVFGPGCNKTIVAMTIAKTFNYHYINFDDVIEAGAKGTSSENGLDIPKIFVKALKRCTHKRIILDNCPPDLSFYLSFQKVCTFSLSRNPSLFGHMMLARCRICMDYSCCRGHSKCTRPSPSCDATIVSVAIYARQPG